MTVFSLVLLLQAPFFSSPHDVARDLDQLNTQIRDGQVDCRQWRSKVALYIRTQDLNSAREVIETLCRVCPGDPVFQEARMMGLALTGDRSQAIGVGEKLLSTFPEYPTIRINLARIHAENGNPARALNLIVSALERASLRSQDWGLAMRLIALLDAQEKPILDRLQAKHVEFPKAKGLIELILAVQIRSGDYDGALAWIEENPFLLEATEVDTFVRHVHEIVGQVKP